MARGPAYPYIDLETAVGLSRKVFEYTKRSSAPVDSVIKEAWGYSPTSSSGVKVYAAMKYYGLVEANENQKTLKLTDRGYRIVVDESSSDEWIVAVQEAALSPRWYKFCWETWGAEMPLSMKRSLIFEHGFVDSTVEGFLKDYKKTIEFSGLASEGPKSQSPSPNSETFGASKNESGPPNTDLPVTVAKPPRGTNVRQEIFSLPEGTVSVEWPGDLSHESFEDLSDWLDILKRKISRAANQAKATQDDSAPA